MWNYHMNFSFHPSKNKIETNLQVFSVHFATFPRCLIYSGVILGGWVWHIIDNSGAKYQIPVGSSNSQVRKEWELQ